MKIAVIGASGKQGSLILQEALNKGHEVLAIVRNRNKISDSRAKILEKDLFDLTYKDIEDYEVIIDAFASWDTSMLSQHTTSLIHLASILDNKPNRLLVVGGASSLFVDKEHKTRLFETPDFPDEYKPVASAMLNGFEELKKYNNVNWTYLSPAAFFNDQGKRTGKYKIGGDELILNSENQSEISYADYAIAMIDEAQNANFIKKRFTVVSV